MIESLDDTLLASEDLLHLMTRGITVSHIRGDQPPAVLLKGGHITVSLSDVRRIAISRPEITIIKQHLLEENMEILLVGKPQYEEMSLVVDVLWPSSGTPHLYVRPRIESMNTHGTGCTLSSAIAANMAKG